MERTVTVERTGTEILPSYVQGSWWVPSALRQAQGPESHAAVVRDASTGEVVTQVSTEGLDLAGALEYARTVGQQSLGALTFHERAMLLKQFAIALTERKQELYELSKRSGSTVRDSLSDIDGGIGVLFTYSSKGRRDLPNAKVYVDGPVESLSKDGSFLGRHVYTRLPGVAVQINAFNFPMWGALEKFAPAFLAGVPSVVKPATPTGYIAEAWVRILVESGLLPAGTLQLVSGSVPTLFDHLRLGDLVGFTGSASTAERLLRRRLTACVSRARPTRSTPRCSDRISRRALPDSTRTSSSSSSSSRPKPGRSAPRSAGRSSRPGPSTRSSKR